MAQLKTSPVGSQRRFNGTPNRRSRGNGCRTLPRGRHRREDPCELLFPLRKKLKVVTHGVAEVPVQGGTIHDMTIPEGYARVMVDRVEKEWEDLDLEIPGGDEKRN